ncbi:EamA family transporter [candidate division KSB1 bacterium]|nr:EamA family transporter [candidate division KSB1 bacterium]
MDDQMSKNFVATILLLIGTAFWGITFVYVKEGISIINLYTFLSIRFIIGAALLALIFIHRMKNFDVEIIKYGIFLGMVLAFSYIAQTVGLQYTSASKAAFITGLSVVFVPLFLSILKKKPPTVNNILAVFVATSGLAVLTLNSGFSINTGDLWVFLCAILFAIYIILVGRYTRIFESIKFTVIQLVTVAVFTGIIAVSMGEYVMPRGYVVWHAILFCAVFATAFMYAIQNQFQKFISEVKAAIIFSFEPLFAAMAAYYYLNEQITFRIVIGGLLIFTGMIISEVRVNFWIFRKAGVKKTPS